MLTRSVVHDGIFYVLKSLEDEPPEAEKPGHGLLLSKRIRIFILCKIPQAQFCQLRILLGNGVRSVYTVIWEYRKLPPKTLFIYPCPGFSASGGSSSRICVSYIAARFSNFSRGPIFGLYILIDRK